MSYPNMSYCMNENTLAAMRQVVSGMEEEGADFLRELSRDERCAFQELFYVCERFLNLSEELQEEVDEENRSLNEDGDSMDGDHDSAMASAGFGTDEDYGYAE